MSATARCPECAADDLLVVNLVPASTPMRFTVCRSCEHRWWQEEASGADVPLGTVIRELQQVG